LKNTKAVDVLATIQSLTGDSDRSAIGREGEALPAAAMDVEVPSRRGEVNPQTPAERLTAPASPFRPLDQQPAGAASVPANLAAEQSLEGDVAEGVRRARDASVTADVNTNSIIVVAPPSVQRLYAELIRRLDERRPQVQIECTIVTLDTSDGFSLGVDTGFMGGIDSSSLITFSSFGVAVVDPTTGALTPTRGRGGTFALLNPSVADIVIRALSSNSRSRLISAPQLLVNDNGKGQLKSVAQQPFAEIVDSNASQAITSFGGQAEAGTTILVEPHISKDDYLQLTYSVELSNFTSSQGQSSGLPPPSQSNSVSSTVTIPDGFTIVVGGLSTRNLTDTFDSVPFINQVPIVKYLFGAQSKTTTDRTLFVFIRPVILRDDKFADLKYLSDRAVGAAELRGDLPASEPIPLR
jgi:general secretion pathway protein D